MAKKSTTRIWPNTNYTAADRAPYAAPSHAGVPNHPPERVRCTISVTGAINIWPTRSPCNWTETSSAVDKRSYTHPSGFGRHLRVTICWWCLSVERRLTGNCCRFFLDHAAQRNCRRERVIYHIRRGIAATQECR